MGKERILYPCYFNAAMKRREGRRVARALAVESPTAKKIAQALKGMGVECRLEEGHHHPCHWMHREGRVVAVWDSSKEELIRGVVKEMGGSA